MKKPKNDMRITVINVAIRNMPITFDLPLASLRLTVFPLRSKTATWFKR